MGAFAGSLVGFVTRKREGYVRCANLGIDLVGAWIEGFILDLLKVDFGQVSIAVSLEDMLSAFIGWLLFLAVLRYLQKLHKAGAAGTVI